MPFTYPFCDRKHHFRIGHVPCILHPLPSDFRPSNLGTKKLETQGAIEHLNGSSVFCLSHFHFLPSAPWNSEIRKIKGLMKWISNLLLSTFRRWIPWCGSTTNIPCSTFPLSISTFCERIPRGRNSMILTLAAFFTL